MVKKTYFWGIYSDSSESFVTFCTVVDEKYLSNESELRHDVALLT